MKMSIAISTYQMNRYNDLIDLFRSINLQTYRDIETIIIVDKNKELFNKIENLLKSYWQTKLIFNPENKGLSYSRNIGIKNATGDIISFVDDDTILDTKWAETVVDTFNDNNIGGVAGDIIPLWEYKWMNWFPKELHWMISCSYIMTPETICEIERGFGTNMAFKRELIERVGMFDTKLGINGNNWIGGEDTDMFLNIKDIGKNILFRPDAKVFHKVYIHRIILKNIMKRAFNGGISVAVMKRLRRKKLRNYDIKNSTEDKYIKKLLFSFYPKKLNELMTRPSIIPLKQMIIVFIVILFESIGYFYGNIMHIDN